MKRQRRLRKLVPDRELIRRRAAGATLRELAADYGVEHTTLSRYFQRAQVAKDLKAASRALTLAERVAADQASEQRRLEREVRKKAKAQAAHEKAEQSSVQAPVAERARHSGRPVSGLEAWLNERDARRAPTRDELNSRNDVTAAEVVASGGGIQAVIDATGLRTLENVTNLINPAILERALNNDLLAEADLLPARSRSEK